MPMVPPLPFLFPPSLYPSTRGPFPSALQLRFRGDQALLDLLIDTGAQGVVGWSFLVNRPEHPLPSVADVPTAAALVPFLLPEGSSYFAALSAWVGGLPGGIGLGARVLTGRTSADVERSVGVLSDAEAGGAGGVVLTVSRPLVSFGVQLEHVHEYFLEGGDWAGILSVENTNCWLARERLIEAAWSASLRQCEALSPRVIYGDALPPPGISALPSQLEAVVPHAFRYWEASDDEARMRHTALRESGFFSSENLRLIDGALYRVDFEVTCTPPSVALPPAPLDWSLDRLRRDLPPDEPLVEVFTIDANELQKASGGGGGAALYFDAGNAEVDGGVSLAKAIDALQNKGVPFAIAAADGPVARSQLAKVARPFRIRPDAELGTVPLSKVFVSSFGTSDWSDVVWVDPPRVSKRGEQSVTRIAKLGTTPAEERFILGIVLEPETVDSQGDIYSAEEIRKTAHLWMEQYRNFSRQHEVLINQKVVVLESYIALCDQMIGDQPVKAGTWLLGVRVLDDELWAAAKAGDITGFSIGGTAYKIPQVQKSSSTTVVVKVVEFHGLSIQVDRPSGSEQQGIAPDGTPWSRTYTVDYGFIPYTQGGDGEELDVFLGPDPMSRVAFWVVQCNLDGSMDEFKVLVGFRTLDEAKSTYLAHVPEQYFGGIFSTPIEVVQCLCGVDPGQVVKAMGQITKALGSALKAAS